MAEKTAVLEWSRWCPYPKIGMRVEYTTEGGKNIIHGIAEWGAFFSDAGVRTPGTDIASWRPESVKVKPRQGSCMTDANKCKSGHLFRSGTCEDCGMKYGGHAPSREPNPALRDFSGVEVHILKDGDTIFLEVEVDGGGKVRMPMSRRLALHVAEGLIREARKGIV